MHCRVSIPEAIEFKTRLGFNQHDLTMIKEQSVLTKIIKVFASEETLSKHSILSYKIDLYLPEYKLAIKFDEKDDNDYFKKTIRISVKSLCKIKVFKKNC